jgi:hypothetical protein
MKILDDLRNRNKYAAMITTIAIVMIFSALSEMRIVISAMQFTSAFAGSFVGSIGRFQAGVTGWRRGQVLESRLIVNWLSPNSQLPKIPFFGL